MWNTEALLTTARTGDKNAMEQMILENNGLIWSVARRFWNRGVEPDDLYQLGCVGFMKAVRGFDPTFGTQFSTYAVPKIAGEIRRFLRDDGPVKVSRTVKERAGAIRLAREGLFGTLGREPALSEIAEKTGFTIEEIAETDLSLAPVESLQRENGEDGFTLESSLGIDSHEDKLCEQLALRDAICDLPEREQQVIGLRYYKSLTQEQTARIVGVSQVQISRIERKAIARLREAIVGN